MSFVTIDKANVTTTSNGTGSITLGPAVTGYQNFYGVGSDKQTYYTITDGANWETGLGTYNTGSSFFFDGTGDFLTLPSNTTIGTAFTFGTDNFTVEFWMYPIASSFYASLFSTTGAESVPNTLRLTTGESDSRMVVSSSSNLFTASRAFVIGTWSHVALVRNGTDLRLYLNGVSVGSVVNSTNFASDTFRIGFASGGGGSFPGFISNFRVVRGDAVYTAAFTPPTEKLTDISSNTRLLTCQSTALVDNSSYNYTITRSGDVSSQLFSPFNPQNNWSASDLGWSYYFDGGASQDFLTLPSDAAFTFGTGNFTVEMWHYPLDFRRYSSLFSTTTVESVTNSLRMTTGDSNGIIRVSTGSTDLFNASCAYRINVWNHIALVRNGTDLRLYLNGVSVGSVVNSTNFTSDTFRIGYAAGVNTDAAFGYFSNIRVVKGTAVYTANFIPLNQPLTVITNTSLLTAQSNTIIDKSSNAFTITVNGQVSTNTFNPFSEKDTVLTRNIVFSSSNNNSLVNFSSNTKNVFIANPAINTQGATPIADDNSIGTNLFSWENFQKNIMKSVNSGVTYRNNNVNGIISTFSLTAGLSGFRGAVLSPNGDVHLVPLSAGRGQKISASGVVSTYSLVYTTTNAYYGGVLAPNGDIHFVPSLANRGQKVSASGVVSTYSLVYTATSIWNLYSGGVLAPNGDIHFIPQGANRGQKVSAAGVVSTYSLVYTTGGAYAGGVLAPNGDIHFVPFTAAVGQKISTAGVVSTYSLAYTLGSGAYQGGVLAPNGDIHFVPENAVVGQKISISGVVSTYSLVYTAAGGVLYNGGVLAPNGDIHFVPTNANRGQKISATGVVSTYPLLFTASSAFFGGVLTPSGDIYFIPGTATFIQKISTCSGMPFKLETCLSSFLNKF